MVRHSPSPLLACPVFFCIPLDRQGRFGFDIGGEFTLAWFRHYSEIFKRKVLDFLQETGPHPPPHRSRRWRFRFPGSGTSGVELPPGETASASAQEAMRLMRENGTGSAVLDAERLSTAAPPPYKPPPNSVCLSQSGSERCLDPERPDSSASPSSSRTLHTHQFPATQEEVLLAKFFWHMVGTRNSGNSATVNYGSDLDATRFGSGFPRDGEYGASPWNLNNLAHAGNSLLARLPHHVSGLTIPWVYVGMLFSAFCWHNEDHFCYSINYNHIGATKHWYGIPGPDGPRFETAARRILPGMFEAQPDLLFHIITLLHPKHLQAQGVPVYTVLQRPGMFVVTFPQSYHGGFNQGFNCAEAVNFCPPDWLSWGSISTVRYSLYHRLPVFSHERILLDIATRAQESSLDALAWARESLVRMALTEIRQRLHLYSKGLRHGIRWSEGLKEIRSRSPLHSLLFGQGPAAPIQPQAQEQNQEPSDADAIPAEPQRDNCCICLKNLWISAVVCTRCSAGHSGLGGGGAGSHAPSKPKPPTTNVMRMMVSAHAPAGSVSSQRLSCLRHAQQLCSCPMQSKILLFRKTVEDLVRACRDVDTALVQAFAPSETDPAAEEGRMDVVDSTESAPPGKGGDGDERCGAAEEDCEDEPSPLLLDGDLVLDRLPPGHPWRLIHDESCWILDSSPIPSALRAWKKHFPHSQLHKCLAEDESLDLGYGLSGTAIGTAEQIFAAVERSLSVTSAPSPRHQADAVNGTVQQESPDPVVPLPTEFSRLHHQALQWLQSVSGLFSRHPFAKPLLAWTARKILLFFGPDPGLRQLYPIPPSGGTSPPSHRILTLFQQSCQFTWFPGPMEKPAGHIQQFLGTLVQSMNVIMGLMEFVCWEIGTFFSRHGIP